MRRLDYAPDPKDIEVTDIATGRFVFPPRPGKPVSLADLQKVVKKAGYEIEGTWIEVAGTLTADVAPEEAGRRSLYCRDPGGES